MKALKIKKMMRAGFAALALGVSVSTGASAAAGCKTWGFLTETIVPDPQYSHVDHIGGFVPEGANSTRVDWYVVVEVKDGTPGPIKEVTSYYAVCFGGASPKPRR